MVCEAESSRANSPRHAQVPHNLYTTRPGRTGVLGLSNARALRSEERRLVRTLGCLGVWRFFFEGPKEFPALDPAVEDHMRKLFRAEVEAIEE